MPSLPHDSDHPKGREHRALSEMRSKQKEEAARRRQARWPGGWEEWLQAAFRVQEWAAKNNDFSTVTVAVKFVSALVQVSELLHHFRELPTGVKAAEQVADRLNVSRTAVFDWLNWLQLGSADFLAKEPPDFNEAVSRLVAKSPTVGFFLEAMMDKFAEITEKAARSPGQKSRHRP